MRKDRKNKAVHFSLRSEGKCDYNLQPSKKLLQNKRQCGIIRHPLLVGQEVMGLHLKNMFRQEGSVEKYSGKYILRED